MGRTTARSESDKVGPARSSRTGSSTRWNRSKSTAPNRSLPTGSTVLGGRARRRRWVAPSGQPRHGQRGGDQHDRPGRGAQRPLERGEQGGPVEGDRVPLRQRHVPLDADGLASQETGRGAERPLGGGQGEGTGGGEHRGQSQGPRLGHVGGENRERPPPGGEPGVVV